MNKYSLHYLTIILLLLFFVSCTPIKPEGASEVFTETEQAGDELNTTQKVETFSVSFTDADWDGKSIPEGQWCSMFDGEGDSPEMLIENIPEGTRFIEIWYNDRTFVANDNGGHGKVVITVGEGETSITVPSFAGESLELPENMFVVELARSSRANGGVYLPPCSGGAGNEYYISFFAYDAEYTEIQNLLGTGSIEMGIY